MPLPFQRDEIQTELDNLLESGKLAPLLESNDPIVLKKQLAISTCRLKAAQRRLWQERRRRKFTEASLNKGYSLLIGLLMAGVAPFIFIEEIHPVQGHVFPDVQMRKEIPDFINPLYSGGVLMLVFGRTDNAMKIFGQMLLSGGKGTLKLKEDDSD